MAFRRSACPGVSGIATTVISGGPVLGGVTGWWCRCADRSARPYQHHRRLAPAPDDNGVRPYASLGHGLADRAGDQTKQYSGGMKRRLNIGIGLLHRPRLLILDEPTVGVDPQSRNAILESVQGLSGAGMAVLYTTHYMEEAERLCDRIGIIDHGKLIAEGTRAELVSLVGEGDQVRLSATGNLAPAAAGLAARSWVREAKALDGSIDLVVEDARSELPAILTDVAASGVTVRSVEVAEPDLEAVFLHMTGRALRD